MPATPKTPSSLWFDPFALLKGYNNYGDGGDSSRRQLIAPKSPVEKPDAEQDAPDPYDMLASELTTLNRQEKTIGIIGSRNIPLPHQKLIESLAMNLVREGNVIVTSGGAMGTNAAAITGAMRVNPEQLRVILPQTIGQQPPDVQNKLIGVPHITEHPERAMMTLSDASRLCNREIIDACDQLIIFLFRDSHTLHKATEYADESRKIVTRFYLD
ncbi:MAG: DNA-processing protein DprA [Vampirovibrionales bacterium]|nr:DNA-processing protein DprA [Vampirovibrionales bacterium]